MHLTEQKVRKLEKLAQARYEPKGITIDYRKPDGEAVRLLACNHQSLVIVSNDEKENIIDAKGLVIFMDKVLTGKNDESLNKPLYEQEGFITLPLIEK
jgi:hypothetical protein